MKKIYISGQITGNPNAFALFESAESFLKSKGFDVVNPMKLKHKENAEWIDFMREDIKAMMDCDAIYMLSNHEKSRGAMVERGVFLALGLPIFYEDYKWTLDKF